MKKLFLFIPLSFLFFSCDDSESEVGSISILSVIVDGNLVNTDQVEVGLNPEVEFTFESAVSKENFENALSIQNAGQDVSYSSTYSNSNSKVSLSLSFESNANYQLSIDKMAIGSDGQLLANEFTLDLSTSGEAAAICTSASNPCLRNFELEKDNSIYSISYYSNYELSGEQNLENIKNAIILIHGANRNNDDYFNWMNNTFEDLSLSNSTVLIAPKFKSQSETNSSSELYWDSNDWREGSNDENAGGISSFTVIDSLIFNMSEVAPNLENIMVTGHSSGGLFTYLYGAANTMESQITELNFEYLVANSQYFYYPTDERVNETTQSLYIPNNCTGYNFWPLGYNVVPNYVGEVGKAILDNQLVNRNIHYLLGNGNQSDPTLNTDDCGPDLLGSSRYKRGENMFFFINERYQTNSHQRTIVQGIGHNGEAMYQSVEFKDLLKGSL